MVDQGVVVDPVVAEVAINPLTNRREDAPLSRSAEAVAEAAEAHVDSTVAHGVKFPMKAPVLSVSLIRENQSIFLKGLVSEEFSKSEIKVLVFFARWTSPLGFALRMCMSAKIWYKNLGSRPVIIWWEL
tara:strand:- start:98 stop:484 length:387 start_codon:yes stop_codon:yes gene_type:complete